MFKFFKAAHTTNEESTSEVAKKSAPHENESSDTSLAVGEKKKVHGEEGVCCGSCGGE